MKIILRCALLSTILILCALGVNQMMNLPWYQVVIMIAVICIMSSLIVVSTYKNTVIEANDNVILENRPSVSKIDEAVPNRDILDNRPMNNIKGIKSI